MQDPERRILDQLTRPTFLNKTDAEELLNELKKRQHALGYLTAQAETQASLDASIREVQADAWDEGRASAGVMLPTKPPQQPTNPYRRDETNE